MTGRECEKKSVKNNPSMIEYKLIIGGIFLWQDVDEKE